MFFQHGSPLKKLDVSPHFLIHGTGKMNPGGFNLDSVVLLGILEGSFQDKDREDKKTLVNIKKNYGKSLCLMDKSSIHGKSLCLMDKSTISMAIFNSKLLVYQRVMAVQRKSTDPAHSQDVSHSHFPYKAQPASYKWVYSPHAYHNYIYQKP